MGRWGYVGIVLPLVGAFFLSGCGSDEGECSMDIQNALDKGRYSTAIKKLEGECSTALTQSDKYYSLATAYMGLGGFGLSDTLKMILDSTDDDNENDTLTSFLSSASDNVDKSTTVEALEKASKYYLMAMGKEPSEKLSEVCADESINDDPRAQSACLYGSVVYATKFTASISYLTTNVDDLVDALQDDDEENSGNETQEDTVPTDMKASMDALEWATGTGESGTLSNGSTITVTSVKINDKDYKHLVLHLDGKIFYRLADTMAPSPKGSTLLTDGYCDTHGDKTVCEGIANEDGSIKDTTKACYACPITFADGETPTTATLLVDALNDSTDAIEELIGDDEDVDIKESIDDFKKEIIGDDENSDRDITIEDIIQYLNDNNDNN